MYIVAAAFAVLTLMAGLSGVVVFAYYSQLDCGPLEAGILRNPNQVHLKKLMLYFHVKLNVYA